MARILAAIVLAIAGAIPLSAGALSLGEIDLKSALNQPFAAEIPVTSAASGDLEALRVEIASIETFQQFGIDHAAFLSDFDFEVVERGSGAVVQITSRRPVVEPFVTLLLEVSWAQGRLLREYTVLLDPPVFAAESVEPAVATPAAEPSVATPLVREEKVPAKTAGAESPRAESVRTTPDESVAASNAGGTYGPVKRNDTLWAIAGRSVGDSTAVSRNQMMLAIYAANPEAFTGNINRLKAGMILRVPSVNEVALNSREATAEVRRQNEQWRVASVARSDEPQGGRLRLVPPPERDTEADPEVAGPDAQAGVDEDQITQADAAERDELRGRVSELEGQLADSQRQLQVRDQELEALQRQLAQISSQPDAAPDIDEPAPVVDLVTPEAEVEAQPGGDIEAPTTAADAPVDVTPVQVQPDEESFIGALFKSPLVYISLAIVLLLAWLLARNRSKAADTAAAGRWDELESSSEDFVDEAHEATTRLSANAPDDAAIVVEEAPADEETDDGSVVPFTDASSEDWSTLVEETETPLERTISTDSAVSLDEADPLAESDFHMAYGLYDQAAELLTRAVESEPERMDLRMKLLEVYFIWKNQDGFLQEAKALQERIDKAADPDWNKVLIMGKQICPGEDLFAGDAAPASSSDSVDLEFGEDGGSDALDMTLDAADEGDSSVDMSFDDEATGLDLDLTGAAQMSDDMSADDSAILDFEIGDEEIGDEDEATQVVDGIDDQEISADAATMETPTIESPAIDGESMMETPTIESPAIDGESTMETPTIETQLGEWADDSDAISDETAEIDLDDLDLDLAGLNEVDDDALGADSGTDGSELGGADADSPFAADTLQFDVPGEDTQQHKAASLEDIADDASAQDESVDDVDSTAEMRNLEATETDPDTDIGDTVEQPFGGGGDTAEQPFIGGGETSEQPILAAVDDDALLDVGELVEDDDPTAEVEDSGSGVDGATMTEVGTKLDLARAYIDMGDPDGACSILNEVLEEADGEQRQEAQQLIDDLTD